MTRDELQGWLRLSMTRGVGNQSARRLLSAFGLPDALFGQSLAALAQVVSRNQASALLEPPPELPTLLDATLNWLNGEGGAQQTSLSQRVVVSLGDPRYPASLLALADPPLLLYCQGRTDYLDGSDAGSARLQQDLANGIAIVGSRNPSAQGRLNARQFSKSLGETGLCIVSGLAAGIDGAAHEGALDATAGMSEEAPRLTTVAVVGTGLDRVYPRAHLALAHRIAREGLLLSEYPIGTPPLAPNFPKRNRIIAGLSRATLVVEAALRSGSLITAREAADQGKDVLAIPGSIHSPQSRGCHALIKQGAKLVESAEDVLEELRGTCHAVPPTPDSPEGSGSKEDAFLLTLGFDPVGLDALQARTGMPTAQLQARLMALELDGHVARLPGNLFQRIART